MLLQSTVVIMDSFVLWLNLGAFCCLTVLTFLPETSCQIESGKLNIDLGKTIVWGPALTPKFTATVRYFFIQAVSEDGSNFTESAGETPFDVTVVSPTDSRTRVRVQIFDKHDGIYIARFKLHGSYDGLTINVLHNKKHVGKSPFQLKGMIQHEKCYCPELDIDQWYRNMGCPASYRQIKLDLAPFRNVDLEASAQEIITRFNQEGAHSLCRYKILDNKVYRKCQGKHVGFKMFPDATLLSLTRKVWFPDMEFFINLGDWPLEHRLLSENPLPIFSWCGSESTRDIIMPTYDITEASLEMMGRTTIDLFAMLAKTWTPWSNKTDKAFWRGRDSCRERLDLVTLAQEHSSVIDARLTAMFFFPKDEDTYGKLSTRVNFFDFFKLVSFLEKWVSLDLISVMGSDGPDWANKTDKAFWRGRDSRQERLDLVIMSRRLPDIIDAAMTHMFFFPKDTEKYGELVKSISFFDFFKHKYQITIDGTVAAYRLPYLLAGDAVVLKQDSPYYEHFYKRLVPYEHYIPFKRNLEDILEKIQWAKDNDEKVQQISKNSQEFVMKNLLPADIFCYHIKLFHEYSKRMKSAPLPADDDWEQLEQPSGRDAQCDCPTLLKGASRDKHDEL